MRRTSLVISTLLLAARTASADTAPLPLPSTEPAPLAAPADLAANALPAIPYAEPESERYGFVLDFGTGLVVPWGEYGKGASATSFGAGLANTLKLGGFFSSHLGINGGVRFSYKHQGMSGCTDQEKQECGGFTYQFPVVAEYAFSTRKAGLYLQAGLGLLSTYSAYGFAQTLKVSSPFDYKVGLGYRWSQQSVRENFTRPSRVSFDVYANLDFGSFERVARYREEAEITAKSTHYMAELGVGLHWTP